MKSLFSQARDVLIGHDGRAILFAYVLIVALSSAIVSVFRIVKLGGL